MSTKPTTQHPPKKQRILGFGGGGVEIPLNQPFHENLVIGAHAPYIPVTPPQAGSPKQQEATVTREEVDAKLERTEAKVEATVSEMKAEFAKFETEMVKFRSDISSGISEMNTNVAILKNTLPSKGFLIVTAISTVAITIAILALGATQFGNGIMASSASVSQAVNAEKVAVEAQRISAENATQLKNISESLGAIAVKFESMQREQAPQQ